MEFLWQDESNDRKNIAYFSHFWNEFINSMRMEDLINDRDRDFLLIPYRSTDTSVIQWPPFLLANKITIVVHMAKDYKESDDDLYRKIKSDEYMYSAFNMSVFPSLSEKLEKFLTLLRSEDGKLESQIVNILQDIVEIIIQDVMVEGHLYQHHVERGQRFVNIDTSFTHNRSVMEKVIRLHLLLTVKESAINVSQNIEARRRITFFANSLLMNMPKAPKVRDMLSFSVLTPYFKDVLYSDEELNKENEDGISILFYLAKIYPDEWANFHERLKSEDVEEDKEELIRQWASYRGHTLYQIVRGMMYYREALTLQFLIESIGDNGYFSIYILCSSSNPEIRQKPFISIYIVSLAALSEGFQTMHSYDKHMLKDAQVMADLKFTYVVSCLMYGYLKKSKFTRDIICYTNILNLMLM
ncbi:putative callose synthase 6, partial [Mucuna pruriens]